MDKETIKAHKISDEEYSKILEILGREPNLLELGVFSAMWSEHCSYKSSKKYLNGFPTKAPWVIQGPGENAGVIDIGGGMVAVFKMESHNHPSYIEPFQGAATGVGGILRDVFTMGARVEANMNSLRFGDIKGNEAVNRYQRYLVKGVSGGISHYGNCMGIPTIGGEISFDSGFNGNILVNAFALGICKKDEIFYGRAEGIGNPVIYVGSKTGRDGLGGAVMASDSFNEENKSLRPTVQVGDPFAEKLLMEACLELFKHDYIIGIQDMGAAGLTSSSFEMSGRSGSGMKMYLDKVPMREEGMTPYELMLSESQERMLICAKKGCEDKIKEIFAKWDLDAEVIGEVTSSGKMELFWHNELVGEIPIDPLSEAAPVLDRPTKKPAYLDEIKLDNLQCATINTMKNQEAFERILKDEHILNKSFVYDQYDANIGTNTIKQPGHLGASVMRVKENNCAIAMGMECNTRMNFVNPKIGAALAVASSGRKVAMSGATPLAITDCLNYGNPENPEVMWQFAQGCEGIKEACKELNTPVVSGNVSLYNDTDGVSIQPTPAIVSVGVNEDYTKTLPSVFQNENTAVYLVGDTKGIFAGSLYRKVVEDKITGTLVEVDYKKERALWDLVISANKDGLLEFANSVGIGGVAMTLAKMSCNAGFGGEFKMLCDDSRDIFDESYSRAIIGVKDEAKFKEYLHKFGLVWQRLGETGGNKFSINEVSMSLDDMKDIYFNDFVKIIKDEK
ncbi:phosphoribosylformylglycinamidine synthase PurLQS, PurL subunit [Campylobacter blaseri]|uniref:Phosphoribosylformylglycinamidine synthase subunit PurL n=1 Tax=Campylobacter blaseri TaxID=2042961 RepID=A0A2P8R029_9BACT|nr:phosphoribosylformylglycinamidine synthase subunit PurL [Campylobacter blaseri]PSM51856.1 phosphoribosylformylglycinamidine synthase II [Campylobacter blaseri]PSM53647.1 phosphoribosylformylglycinamidine synthase II [Campylobacter blaseri]QKF86309.1 phosphoribosylformylglycinamidine synthase PurLQS, PurL subunit [Campylobacter blaseri]